VVVADIDPVKGQRVVKEIEDAGGDAIFIEADVSKVSDMEKMVKTTVETYGKLNILYNHAGIPGPKGIEDVTEEEWERCIKVNMLGSFFATKFAVPEMGKAGGGSVLFTTSTAGIRVYPGTPFGKAIASGSIKEGLYPAKANALSPWEPVFYLSPYLGSDASGLISVLLAHGLRFLFLGSPSQEGSYNYADLEWTLISQP